MRLFRCDACGEEITYNPEEESVNAEILYGKNLSTGQDHSMEVCSTCYECYTTILRRYTSIAFEEFAQSMKARTEE